MPKPAPKRKAVKKTKPKRRATAAKRPPTVRPPSKKDEAAYLESLIETGQAAPATGGKMPPGATHALVKDEVGGVKAVRRRFSIS